MILFADNVDGTVLFLSIASKVDMIGYFSMWSGGCSRGSRWDWTALSNVAVRIVLDVRVRLRSIAALGWACIGRE